MSFTQGFEKVAFLGKAIGYLGGTATKATRGATEAVKGFAQKQRAGRLEAYRGALYGKKAPAGGTAANIAIQKSNATGQAAENIRTAKRAKALSRLDRMSAAAQGKKGNFIQKHPYLTAAGVYLAARHMSGGGDQQPPQPPPQIVQY